MTSRNRVSGANPMESPGARLLGRWRALSRWPGGRKAFSVLLGRWVRYTGSIRPLILELEPGVCRVQLRDRPAVRNHLRSVHAVALTNLGEVTGGLAMTTALQPSIRGIVVRLETQYTKKARGVLIAEARCSPPEITEPMDFEVQCHIRDGEGDVVATTTAHWRLAPR